MAEGVQMGSRWQSSGCHRPLGNGQGENNYGFWGSEELSWSPGHGGWDILTCNKGLGLPFSHWGLGYFTGAIDGTVPSLYSGLRGLDGSFFLQNSWAHDKGELLIAQ